LYVSGLNKLAMQLFTTISRATARRHQRGGSRPSGQLQPVFHPCYYLLSLPNICFLEDCKLSLQEMFT